MNHIPDEFEHPHLFEHERVRVFASMDLYSLGMSLISSVFAVTFTLATNDMLTNGKRTQLELLLSIASEILESTKPILVKGNEIDKLILRSFNGNTTIYIGQTQSRER